MATEQTPKTVYLKDYLPPAYLVERIDLTFHLGEELTTVIAEQTLFRNPDSASGPAILKLNGRSLRLIAVSLDGIPLPASRYTVDDESLSLDDLPQDRPFTLLIETEIKPQLNTALTGLYKSSGNFCTQCEAEGFRNITYYQDRPDVMARFTTTIYADKTLYPVLLSNGNLVASADCGDGRYWAKWEDPFKKPSYLFALVAGQLEFIEDSFTTMSGRRIPLRIYVQKRNIEKCEHAMHSLKLAMKWDEEAYGREYDLDLFMIVSVDDFNMGAMENKGLNIFNSALVLAKPETATDVDYDHITGVIGHEYFHNWSGNRVTCRDWFQLSLKEGFTVFRDEMFTADMTSHAVKRIQDVSMLRAQQFREDSGPLAHPVRPESYVEINNFYTHTVYTKGAEVVRMYHTLLGADTFRKGTDLYFERHDGQAVTTDDFARAMEEVSGRDLTQFKRWYSQAGTPVLDVTDQWNQAAGQYILTIAQHTPPTPGQDVKQPFHIPVRVGLLAPDGSDCPLAMQGETDAPTERVLELREATQRFVFTGLSERPTPSLLRGFSAPVKLNFDYSNEQLAFLMGNDRDEFNRWDMGQRLGLRLIAELMQKRKSGEPLSVPESFIKAVRNNLTDTKLDKRLIAEALILPEESYVAEQTPEVDPQAIHAARRFVIHELAVRLHDEFLRVYNANRDDGPYTIDGAAIGRRTLKNICLAYLVENGTEDMRALCMKQFESANNMSDQLAALMTLANCDCPQRKQALDAFYEQWKDEPLVVDKWIIAQSSSRLPDTLETVKSLMSHPAFTMSNPNKVRALVAGFAMRNLARFHDPSGAGYEFLADRVLELNKTNPQIAARLLTPLSGWRRYIPGLQKLMKAQLERIMKDPDLSRDVYEIADKSLG
jgi:aminopeptidase N